MVSYDDMAEGYDALHHEEQFRKAKIIASELQLFPEDKLLDVGCGPGLYLELFHCSVFGIDPSEKLLAMNPFPHQQAKAEDLPFPDRHFDVVISITAIHNFEDIAKGLQEMKRVGKDRFAFAVLKASKQFDNIDALLHELFTIKKIVLEEKDAIYFLTK